MKTNKKPLLRIMRLMMLAVIIVIGAPACYGQKAMKLKLGNCLANFSKYEYVNEFKLIFTNDNSMTFKVHEWKHSHSRSSTSSKFGTMYKENDLYCSYYYPTKEEMKYCQEHKLKDWSEPGKQRNKTGFTGILTESY